MEWMYCLFAQLATAEDKSNFCNMAIYYNNDHMWHSDSFIGYWILSVVSKTFLLKYCKNVPEVVCMYI